MYDSDEYFRGKSFLSTVKRLPIETPEIDISFIAEEQRGLTITEKISRWLWVKGITN